MKVLLALAVLALCIPQGRAEAQEGEREALGFPFHDIVVSSSATIVPGVINPDTQKNASYVVAGLGFGYTFAFSEQFALATKNDIEFLNIEVEDTRGRAEGEPPALLRRENVFILTAGALYSPLPRAGIYVGGGVEVDQHGTLPTLALTLEYDFVEDWKDHRGRGAGVEAGMHYKTTYTSFFVGMFIAFGWW